jgi:hypothetical protein
MCTVINFLVTQKASHSVVWVQNLRVSENRELRRISGPKRLEKTA